MIHNNAIVITGDPRGWPDQSQAGQLTIAHKVARNVMGGLVSELVEHRVNGLASFFVSPDGSKVGWADRELADRQRSKLIEYLRTTRLEWFMVRSGPDMQSPPYVEASNREED